MKLLKRFLILCALLATWMASPAFTHENFLGNFKSCGQFEAAGRISFENHHFILMVYAGTLSEIRLRFDDSAEFHVAPYLNRAVQVTGLIDHPIENQRGRILFERIQLRVPNPIHPMQDSGFRLLHNRACQKG